MGAIYSSWDVVSKLGTPQNHLGMIDFRFQYETTYKNHEHVEPFICKKTQKNTQISSPIPQATLTIVGTFPPVEAFRFGFQKDVD